MKSLLARFAPSDSLVGRPPMGRVLAYYGAKGGVGTTTIAINAAIALQRARPARSCLVDGNLQFGDHRVFLDLGLDRKSIVDVVSAPAMRQRPHPQGRPDARLRRRPAARAAVARGGRPGHARSTCTRSSSCCAGCTTTSSSTSTSGSTTSTSMVLDVAETIFVVMTADLSCLKNVRLVLETIGHLGYEASKLKLVLNRSNAFTGINVKSAEGALRRPIEHQIVNEYRGAISRAEHAARRSCSRKADSRARAVAARLRAGRRQARRRARRSRSSAPAPRR